MDPTIVAALITAVGVGGVLQAGINWLSTRKRTVSESNKLDTDAELAKLSAVIDRLDDENKRIVAREQRTQAELLEKEERILNLRTRVRELEDEIDGIRRTSRETEQKCEELSARLRKFLHDTKPSDRDKIE